MAQAQSPNSAEATYTEWGVAYLNAVLAIDSQSDEESDTMPSTDGQKQLSSFLQETLTQLGFEAEQDPYANLIVTIPAHPDCADAPTIALMAHLDTSRGTQAISELNTLLAWDGTTPIPYPENNRLSVNTNIYPETQQFVGEDLLFGPGKFPVGLDNKLGMCEMMGLAKALSEDPSLPHGEILLVFRPDEEIGRMEVLEGLADLLKSRGVSHGYTIDGLDPFEVNVENFNASRGRVILQGQSLETAVPPHRKKLKVRVFGVKSHGATAKAEGYRNALLLFARAMHTLGHQAHIVPVDLQSDPTSEVNADITFVLQAQGEKELAQLQESLMEALLLQITPHKLRGAALEILEDSAYEGKEQLTDEGLRLARHLHTFLTTPGVTPLLSEESEGHQGYSNPYFVQRQDSQTFTLDYRLRAFTPEELAQRGEHLKEVCAQEEAGLPVTVEHQYVNMGPALVPYPELVDWAERAALAIGQSIRRNPIRGGTGVDPFLDRNIPIANLGTGYFAPESEKEFTTRQTIGRHIRWLVQLAQVVGRVN